MRRAEARGFSTIGPPKPEYGAAQQVVRHDGAIVTRFTKSRGATRRLSVTTGAVHTRDGVLVPSSQRVGGLSGDHVTAVDPDRTDERPEQELSGRWMYVGHWMAHFGHFLTETLTTMWAPDRRLQGLVGHRFIWDQPVPVPWQLELVEAAGLGQPVHVVDKRSVRVEELLVPTRPFVSNAIAAPEAMKVFDRVASRAPRIRAGKIFVSRSHFHARHLETTGAAHRRSLLGEDELDHVMQQQGFTVIYPEDLPVLTQVGTAAGAEVIAGISGTALHLAAFAGPGTRVLELGDIRSPDGLSNQKVIAAARKHAYRALPIARTGAEGQAEVDVEALTAGLAMLDLSTRRLHGVGRLVSRRLRVRHG